MSQGHRTDALGSMTPWDDRRATGGVHSPRASRVRNPPRWHPMHHMVHALAAKISRLSGQLGVPMGGRVLDYGCGEMPYEHLFRGRAEIVGADLPGNPSAVIEIAPDGRVPVENETFDAVLSTQVLEHVSDPALYLSECYRVLRPGGRMLLSTHGIMNYHPDPIDYWRWTCAGLRNVVEAAGFEIVRFEGMMGLASTGLQLVQDAIYYRLHARWLSWGFALVMQAIVALVDRIEPAGSTKHNALVFAVVATRPESSSSAPIERAPGIGTAVGFGVREPRGGPSAPDRLTLADPADRRIVERAGPYSITGASRMLALIDAVRYCVHREIPGDFAECGVWRGGSVMAMILTLQDLGVEDRDIHLYDTFSGMTEPTAPDTSAVDRSGREHWEASGGRPWQILFDPATFNEDTVRNTVLSAGYPAERLHFVAGPVEETLPERAPESLALLRLDTDWYESTRHELVHLYPRLADGGVLIVDDYGHWEGARQAVDKYFSDRAEPVLLNRIDYSCRVAVKH